VRYTKVSGVSYVVAIVLLAVAAGFAAWRAQPAPRGSGTPGAAPSAGQLAYTAECASCHPSPAAISGSLEAHGDWRPIADLLLTGEARLIDRGGERTARRHPAFDECSDERLSAIIGYLVRNTSVAGAASRGSPPTPAEVQTRRAGSGSAPARR
jgi:cytochrome c5